MNDQDIIRQIEQDQIDNAKPIESEDVDDTETNIGVYDPETLHDFVDNDMISNEEEGFMIGYMEE
ncbi:TPA: hypothetical protein HA251_00960 [Candidatus Woesearchaeota archaeon]|nr:hypothetical protein [Candidatus Woesearchaeota archaeon]